MALSNKEVILFYKLWLSLLQFVNNHYHISDSLPKVLEQPVGLDVQAIARVASYLFEHLNIVDEYLSENPDHFDDEKLEIIRTWKYPVKGYFYVERILKKGAMLISLDGEVYCVSSLVSSWEEMVRNQSLPVIIQTVLLPFKDQITYASVMQGEPVSCGGGIQSQLKEKYLKAKRAGQIIDTAKRLIQSEKRKV
ncbi:hypothetical protein AAK899_02520 [Erysipelotrichaceae bacterium 51-3]